LTARVLRRFAISRGYVASTRLPRSFPKPLHPFVPSVYSHEELKRLLSAIVANDIPRSVIDPTTFRLLLLMLYGAEPRISEALRLTFADVDLSTAVLHFRESIAARRAWCPLDQI
jgi:integrase/recombinase XerD